MKKVRFIDTNYIDAQYHGISDISRLLCPVSIDKYYEPELVASAFDSNYERYHINGDQDKKLSFNEYLNLIRPNVIALLNTKSS